MGGAKCRLLARGPAATGVLVAVACCVGLALGAGAPRSAATGQPPTFGSRVDLVVVNLTVTDAEGHFVRGLRPPDLALLEDGRPQPIAAFSSQRVPVSLGIALDISASMAGKKTVAARAAVIRLLDALPDPDDEVFLLSFADEVALVQGWTLRRDQVRRALDGLAVGGATSLYDGTAQALAFAGTGKHPKKALVIISDGNDTASHQSLDELVGLIRKSDVLIYAIGVDSSPRTGPRGAGPGNPVPGLVALGNPQRPPWPLPAQPPRNPQPPGSGPGGRLPPIPPPPPRGPVPGTARPSDTPVDASALHALTDPSGGRTEIVRDAGQLSPAIEGIADELSQQYFLAYSAARDGRWHAIEVVVRGEGYRVRARQGYLAAPPDRQDRQR